MRDPRDKIFIFIFSFLALIDDFISYLYVESHYETIDTITISLKNSDSDFQRFTTLDCLLKKKLKEGSNLGICHLQIGKELFRTPLGGFINHSDDPNCTKSMARITNSQTMNQFQ